MSDSDATTLGFDPGRLSVFLSGSGRTLVNLHRAIGSGRLDARIVDVVASRDCVGVSRARELGLPTEILPVPFTAESLLGRVRAKAIGLIVLAGYLKLLPVPPAMERRILNIHPALLPGDGTGGRFGGRGLYGMRVHRAVLDAGEGTSGCTVHYCSPVYDAGPVLIRRTCPVETGDTPETLAARVFEQELEAYPEAVQLAITEHRTSS
jgi:phosphoribosylglycinamide formyltransferase-1